MRLPFTENALTRWFARQLGEPTPVQIAAWPEVSAGRSTLIVAPTGTGKTLAACFAVLHELAGEHTRGVLPNAIRALYLSPLRALGYDVVKNLRLPLAEAYGGDSPIRVGLRTGDTTPTERQQQLTRPPHVLVTTPESLCLLLSQAKWTPVLRTVRWVVVDELHALAENKRGAHLSLSLERLEALAADQAAGVGQGAAAAGAGPLAGSSTRGNAPAPVASRLQRIGLSATVAPIAEMARYLCGTGRDCAVVDVGDIKRVRLEVHSPLAKQPYPAAGYTGVRLMRDLARLVERHRTTLVFTNTRSGAEAATFWLRAALPAVAGQIECHHASLDRDVRLEVEDRLKRGELRAVVCSTSLELGIDIGSVDLVVMLATPKGVTKALQRAGRSGHNLRTLSRGVLMATNVNDLIECSATVLLARRRHLETVRLPQAPLDVLAQHLVGMGCLGRWTRADAWAVVRRAWPYRDLSATRFEAVLDYLAGGGRALRQNYTELFGKITLDEQGFETPTGRVRRDFLQNIGVIPNEALTRIRFRSRSLGTVEESFARRLRPGDAFLLGGRVVEVERHGMMEVFVRPADHRAPTIPRWNANKMPLSNRVAEEIVRFRSELRARLENGAAGEDNVAWIARRLACGRRNARIIDEMHRVQHRVSEIPTADFLLIEEHSPGPATDPAGGVCHYLVHSLIGRAANDALSRVVAIRLSRLRGGNAVATPDDYGFVLTVSRDQRLAEAELPTLLSNQGLGHDLQESLTRSELLKYHFRNAAQTGLMVYRNYFGTQKPVRKLQFSSEVIFNVLTEHEPQHVLLEEARRDAVHTYLDLEGAERFLDSQAARTVRLRVIERIPPLSFGMFASKIREALLVEDPTETLEKLYRQWWEQLEPPPSV